MRQYILTDKERKAIERFLKDGKPTNLIYVIRHRTARSLTRLGEDIELLQRLKESHRFSRHDQ